MKPPSPNDLFRNLKRFAASLNMAADDATRDEAIKALDDVLLALNRVRQSLSDDEVSSEARRVGPALNEVIGFLDSARTDPRFSMLFAAVSHGDRKAKRQPLKIEPNLSNQQIREHLQRDLSVKELRAIALQRGVAAHNANSSELKRAILENLNRQEGYERLAGA